MFWFVHVQRKKCNEKKNHRTTFMRARQKHFTCQTNSQIFSTLKIFIYILWSNAILPAYNIHKKFCLLRYLSWKGNKLKNLGTTTQERFGVVISMSKFNFRSLENSFISFLRDTFHIIKFIETRMYKKCC